MSELAPKLDNDAEPTPRPLRVAEYETLIESGAFIDERVELFEGRLIRMSRQKPAHASIVQKLTKLLVRSLDESWDVRVQLPLVLSDDSEPEPDLTVVRAGDYSKKHPTTAVLVVEVAETSLAHDRAKANLYARAQIGTYWLVDVKRGCVEVRTEPRDGQYHTTAMLTGAELLRIEGVQIAINQLIGR